MTKRTTTGVLLVVGAFVAAACAPDAVLPSGPDLDAELHRRGRDRGPRVEVCHFRNNGKYKKIRVDESGAARHLERHDRDEAAEDGVCPPRTDKVPVCHRGKVKMVREFTRKYERHLAHGDELGSCDAPAPDPTIEVLTHVFTPFPWGGDGGNLNVSFTSANCDGDVVIYQLVGTFDGLVRGGTIGSGDGPHTINGLIPPVPPDLNTDYMVRGACDNGEAVSTAFAK